MIPNISQLTLAPDNTVPTPTRAQCTPEQGITFYPSPGPAITSHCRAFALSICTRRQTHILCARAPFARVRQSRASEMVRLGSSALRLRYNYRLYLSRARAHTLTEPGRTHRRRRHRRPTKTTRTGALMNTSHYTDRRPAPDRHCQNTELITGRRRRLSALRRPECPHAFLTR